MAETVGGKGPITPEPAERLEAEEQPTTISDEVRAQWKDTFYREGAFLLVDSAGKELARVPFNEVNRRHFDDGPVNNEIETHARALGQINDQLRAAGKPEFRTYDEWERDSSGTKGVRNKTEKTRAAYPEEKAKKIRDQMTQELSYRQLHAQAKVAFEAAIARIGSDEDAVNVSTLLQQFPESPGARPVRQVDAASQASKPAHRGAAGLATTKTEAAAAGAEKVPTAAAKERYRGAPLPEGTPFADEPTKKAAIDALYTELDALAKLGGVDVVSRAERIAKVNSLEAEKLLKDEMARLRVLLSS